MRQQRMANISMRVALLLPVLLFSSALFAATIEVEGVAASDPGRKNQSIPDSLAKYRAILGSTTFGSFKNIATQTVRSGGSATIDKYTVDVAVVRVEGKAKVEITVKEGGNAIASPLRRALTPGKSFSMQVGSKDAPTIFIFTILDAD